MATVEQLKTLAIELNTKLDLEPAIKTGDRATKTELESLIKEAVLLIQKKDKFSKEAIELMTEMEILPSFLKKKVTAAKKEAAEVSRYGSRVGTSLAALDDLFWAGVTVKDAVKTLQKNFPEKYPKDEDGARRAEGRIWRHFADLNAGKLSGREGQAVEVKYNENTSTIKSQKASM